MSSGSWVRGQVLEHGMQEPGALRSLRSGGKCKQFTCNVLSCCCIRWNASKGGRSRESSWVSPQSLSPSGFLTLLCPGRDPLWPLRCPAMPGKCGKPAPWKSLPVSLPHHFKCGRADNNIFPKVQHWLPLSPLVVSEELGTLKDKTCLLLPAPTPAPQYLWILKTGPRVPFHITDPRGWRVQNPPTRSQEPSLSEERPPQAPVRLQCENGPSSLSTYSGFKLKTGKRELMNCKIRKNYQEK